MHFAFNSPLENIIFCKNIIKYDKSWSFLFIIWDKENKFFLLIIWNGGSTNIKNRAHVFLSFMQ